MRSCFSGRRIGMKQGVVGGKQDSGSVSNGLHQLTSASGAFLTCTKGSFQSCVKNKNDPPPPQFCLHCNSVTHAISGTSKVVFLVVVVF